MLKYSYYPTVSGAIALLFLTLIACSNEDTQNQPQSPQPPVTDSKSSPSKQSGDSNDPLLDTPTHPKNSKPSVALPVPKNPKPSVALPVPENPKPSVAPTDTPTPAASTVDLSDFLGFANRGNTCFANASHNLILKHPHMLSFLNDKTIIKNNPKLPVGRYTALTQLRDAFYHLFSEREGRIQQFEATQIVPPSNQYYRDELDALFDRYDDYLINRNTKSKKPYFNDDKEELRRDQIDADEYLYTTFDALKYRKFFHVPQTATFVQTIRGRFRLQNQNDGPYVFALPLLDDKNQPLQSVTAAVQDYFSAKKNPVNSTERTILISSDPSNQLPDQLIIQLNRYDNSRRKLSHPVKISSSVSVEIYPADIQADEIQNNTRPPARLQMHPAAVIVHHGTPKAGHYTAYLFDEKTNQWTLHNDQQVTLIQGAAEEALAQDDMEHNGTVILYIRDGFIPS
jgi:ubiquitin C-terminal hydrolase